MDHETHIGFVNTHAERDGGDDDLSLFHQEVVLVLHAGLGIETSMVRQRTDTVLLQQHSQFLHFFAAQAVNDTRFARVVLDKFDHFLIDILVFLADFIIEVRAVERRNEHFGLFHAEVLLDIALHLGGGGGSQRNHGHIFAYLLDNLADVSILRTEVMPPFRNTVCLVDGVKRDVDILEKVHVLFLGQGFGRDIQQFRFA